MLDTLFGAEMPLAVKFFLAFVVVLGLILGLAWAVRRFGTGRLGSPRDRRQPRLAVIDHASVDGRRRLILVRRDNVEHLLMIGGPTDVVVEPNIVRAVAAPRDVPGARPPAGIEALPRAIPLPETAGNGSWPLQPEPVAAPRPRVEPLPDELAPRLPHAEPSRPPRDTLAALADELSPKPTLPRRAPMLRPLAEETGEEHGAPAEPRAEIHPEPHPEPRQEGRQESRQEIRQESQPESRPETHPEPRQEPAQELKPELRPEIRHPVRPEPRKPLVPPAPPPAPATAEADQSLADMAQRLEAALRRQPAEGRPAATPPRPAPQPAAAESAPQRPPRPSEPKPLRSEAAPNQGKSTLYDSLEQEMASLLGRQNKT